MQRSEEHTSELQSHVNLVCRLLLEKKKKNINKSDTKNKNKHIRKNIKITNEDLTSWQSSLYIFFFPSIYEVECCALIFFFNDTATTEIYTLSLHDALPI